MKSKNRKKMNLTKLYLGTVIVFILGFVFIFITPMFTGGNYSYAEATMNEYQTLGNNLRIALVKKEYNPEKEIVRLDFSITETTKSGTTLPNIEYEVSSQYIKNRKGQEVEVTRVSDEYFVAIIKEVPKDFSVLSTTVSPKYIHSELADNNDLENRSVKVYVNESEDIVNNSLDIGTKEVYQKEFISFQQDQIKNEIEEKEIEIEKNKLAIKELNKLISSLESELIYQTREEQFETNNLINSHVSSINKHEKDIVEIEEMISEMNEKTILLEEKKTSI